MKSATAAAMDRGDLEIPNETAKEVARLLATWGNSAGDPLREKDTANRLDLKNHHTLAVWRSTKRYPELRWRKIGRNVRYLAGDVAYFLVVRARR